VSRDPKKTAERARRGPRIAPPGRHFSGQALATRALRDMLHSSGIDLAPFTQLFRAMRDKIQGRERNGIPTPASFADGVALQRILDAVLRSSARESWEPV
jgi:predicted dehydrogenase